MVAAEVPHQGILTALVRSVPAQTLGHRESRRRVMRAADQGRARVPVGLAGVPTIVAIGPFDDQAYARQLAAAFITVRWHCDAQLVLLGSGAQRTAVTRHASAQGVGDSVLVVKDSCDTRWSEVVAAADLVVLSSSSGTATLLDVLAAGRAVVAPADPATVPLVVPGIAGLVYPAGDASGMAAALLRLLTTPVLRRGMAGRATNVARRHRLEIDIRHRSVTGTRP
jgi:glycosyltransferase involved in cell wall biosynthesis